MDSESGFTERPLPAEPTWTRSETWSEARIPPRPWLARGYFLRLAVSLLIGPSGVSKSSLVLAWAVALVFGRDLNKMHPTRQFRAAIYNVEDDADEQERRLSAALRAAGKLPDDVAGLILRTGPTGVGSLFRTDPVLGVVPTLAMLKLEQDLFEFGADVLFVDPLAELHDVEENDNNSMRAIVAAFRALASRCQIAVVIIHHTRKGLQTPGDPEIGRGAGAVVGASRVTLTITGMTADNATAFNLPTGHERHFFRVDGAKSNYSALNECEWFERITYALENGDEVAAAVPWTPPADIVTIDSRLAIERGVAEGSPVGPWSAKLSGDPRSIKQLFLRHGVQTLPGQKTALAALTAAGFLQAEYRKPGNRAKALGLRSPDCRPSTVEWTDDGPEA